MATAYVAGLQGEDRRVLATLKHYVGHAFSEGGRNHAPVRIGERELNDTFLLPFEMAVKLANAGSVMPAYHDIDGEPSSSSRRYMTEVLRDRWGFDGIVVSDYMAIPLLQHHHRVARDAAEAAALALNAGMDQELPDYACYRSGLPEALKRGLIAMDDIDAAVGRVLVEKSRLGLFESPYVDIDGITLNTKEHRSVATEAATKSIVLLKNDGTLPLNNEGTVALIGPLADDQLAVFCGYSFPVHLIMAFRLSGADGKYAKTLKEAFEDRIAKDRMLHARGCDVLTERPMDAPVFPSDENTSTGRQESFLSFDTSRIDDAVATALEAETVVVALGDLAGLFMTGTVGEGSDATSLELPGVQQQLLERLLDTGKPVVVVLMNGRPYNLGVGFEKAAAVIEAFLPGQEGADAIVDVLYGDANPGGRLPVSIPKTAGAMPYFYNHKMKSGGFPIQPDFGAVFPFGFGLSYTTFEYDDFAVKDLEVPVDGTIEVECSVRNTGQVSGDEVVQLYVRDCNASLVRPVRELKGFKRITLDSGAAARVTFALPVDMLGFTVEGVDRIVEPGEVEVMIGASSEHIHHRATVTLVGETRRLPEDWRMRCETDIAAL
jgi:beta-xylosidase